MSGEKRLFLPLVSYWKLHMEVTYYLPYVLHFVDLIVY